MLSGLLAFNCRTLLAELLDSVGAGVGDGAAAEILLVGKVSSRSSFEPMSRMPQIPAPNTASSTK